MFSRCFFLAFLMFVSLLLGCYCDDECEYNKDCTKNGTKVCCHRRSGSSVCRETCQDESCYINWDCGTDQNFVCCSNHICKNSDDMCPDDNGSWPIWVIVVVVFAILVVVFGVSATVFCIYRRHSKQYNNI